ncbi:methionine synthase [Pseudonocardia asaccharolytica DSM 44247 = NBRC 16224]|uniref:Methionine synthase n=1 Tax=Pseudonocardia asaccharolytica DSM 44247 = NBRC 16224 TaxID=1123024 RepID=A0A511D856_9PSEU|nr:methionine synthase [Pseudonocardia asaccharolytica]GEL19118.1 methionine synthase [Pseudonocardia asaccharolytica DSM 44247 = NBRC 16224]
MSTPSDPLAEALAAAGLSGAVPGGPAPAAPDPGGLLVTAPEPERVEEPPVRWSAGAATGVGSLPGTVAREAAATVVGELPALPHLPELPARGAGADPIGRAAALLVDLAVEVVPTAYRVTARPGRDQRRAVDLLRGDVDAFDEACDPVRPDWVKVQVAGPWTLAASVELRSGHRVLTDHGAVREFTESLAEGLCGHVAEIAARTGARVLVQLDEPSLPAVLCGSLPTASGYGTVRAVPEPEVADALRGMVDQLAAPVVVHCCAERPPVRLLAGIGAAGIGIDATQPALSGDTAVPAMLDALGEVWDTGTPLLLGLVPVQAPSRPPELKELARTAFDLADRLGFDRSRLPELVVPTPACGLVGATPEWARRAMSLARQLGEAFTDPPEGW